MGEQVRIGVVGLGKMGLSHFAIVNAHPDTETCASETSGFLVGLLDRYVPARMFRSHDEMLEEARPDAVVIATPSRLHASMVRTALERGVHVFCEKPFCLDPEESEALAELAAARGLVGQVGYHNRFVGAFRRMKQVVDSGALGRITHVLAEAYGPVVLRSKRQSWRTQKTEGGGCLYDYAAHPLNLLNWMFGAPDRVSGSALIKVFSTDIDDEVLSTLQFRDGPAAQLSVNWSDESHRKMTTSMTLIGTRPAVRRPSGMPDLSAPARGGPARRAQGLDGEPYHRADRGPLVLSARRGIFRPDRRLRGGGARWPGQGGGERLRLGRRHRPQPVDDPGRCERPAAPGRTGRHRRGWFGR